MLAEPIIAGLWPIPRRAPDRMRHAASIKCPPEVAALLLDLPAFRGSVEKMLNGALKTPEEWMRCFLEILAACTQLYVDYARLKIAAPALSKLVRTATAPQTTAGGSQIALEAKMRHAIKRRLKSAVPWVAFCPENEFSRWTDLWVRQDYIDNLSLSLSEIYGQTISAEASVNRFKAYRAGQALADMLVRSEFMAMHHLGTAIKTLQWAADEGSWMDLGEAKAQRSRMIESEQKRGVSKREARRGADAFAATRSTSAAIRRSRRADTG